MHIIIGLIIAFVLVALFVRRNWATRRCRWRADATGNDKTGRKYRCMACGAVAYTDHAGPPRHCELARHGL